MIAAGVTRLWVTTVAEPLVTDWHRVSGRRDVAMELMKAEIDASHMDGNGWSDYLPGRKDARLVGTLLYMEDDPGQALLIDNAYGTVGAVYVRFRLLNHEYVGKGFVREFNPFASDEAVSEISIQIRIDSAIERFFAAYDPELEASETLSLGDVDDDVGNLDAEGYLWPPWAVLT